MSEHRNDVDRDPLYEEAVAVVLETRKATVSWVQRKLRIGYNRTARMLEIMEDEGILGPYGASGVRPIYGREGAAERVAARAAAAAARAAVPPPAVEARTSTPSPSPSTRVSAVAALRNCLALASRHRNEPWAEDIRRFCAQAGVTPSPLRGGSGDATGV